jgi:hypothetical protein
MLSDDLKMYQLYLEGAAEDMISSGLTKLQAPQDIIQFFLQKEAGKLIFKPEHVSILYSWIKDQHADQGSLVEDYKAYQKFFQNKPLTNFNSYLNWTEEVHEKKDKAQYQSRNKNLKGIDISGEDKENVLADDENVLILKGDNEHKCVRYGRNYSFCISRPGGGNMYSSYRFTKSSTFYFIFFKKVPKSDKHHIMVLDKTADGWEWTFADNGTQTIQGGWNEIIKKFPVLAKYETLFVNKPLTDPERIYQDKLKKFAKRPTLQDFKQFSYNEKSDVLKFGMLIPLDLFQSLDDDLRNEWISVGPKMSEDIYELLADKEKQRFFIVRKQQLTLRKPQDKFDIEICNKDPILYRKYLKRDKELFEKEEKEILSKIIDGICNGDIVSTSKYSLPNLNNLKEINGNIKIKSIGELSLPQLQKCRNITADQISSLSAPQLQICKNIEISDAKKISCPQLQIAGKISIAYATIIELPQLQTSGLIFALSVVNLYLPQLQTCKGNINCGVANINIDLPKLQNVGGIYSGSTVYFNLPKLQSTGGSISAESAKKIIIPFKFKSKLWDVSEECEIIEPIQELNDSIFYKNKVVLNSFKQFFDRI